MMLSRIAAVDGSVQLLTAQQCSLASNLSACFSVLMTDGDHAVKNSYFLKGNASVEVFSTATLIFKLLSHVQHCILLVGVE